MYKNPAPYREQILTYSTALAFTGRSAACAPLIATRAAAEPRTRLLTNFMLNLQVALSGIGWVKHPQAGPLACVARSQFASRLRTHPHEREGLKRSAKCAAYVQKNQ